MFNKSQLFFIYKTKSVNLFQEMTRRVDGYGSKSFPHDSKRL